MLSYLEFHFPGQIKLIIHTHTHTQAAIYVHTGKLNNFATKNNTKNSAGITQKLSCQMI